MAPAEAQKRASAKYQGKNIASLACRVKKEQAEQFKAYCAAQGKTSNAVLREFVMKCIREDISSEKSSHHYVFHAVKRKWRKHVCAETLIVV